MEAIIRMLKEDLLEPTKCTCGTCGGIAYIVPFGNDGKGTCICSKCTFGENKLTLLDMINRIFNKDHPRYIGDEE